MPLSRLARIIGYAAGLGLATPTLCEPAAPSEACAFGVDVAKASAAPKPRIQIARESAVFIVEHVQRACGLLRDAEREGVPRGDKLRADQLREIALDLRAKVLEPIYRLFPDIQGRDLTSTRAPQPPRLRQMGPATATYLRWSLEDAQRRFFALNFSSSCAEAKSHDDFEQCSLHSADAGVEIGFAANPAYANYPSLWRLAAREADTLAAKQRSVSTDAEFRKDAPPVGSVKLTREALAQVRRFLAAARPESGARCQVARFDWVLETWSRAPDGTDWKKDKGPALSLGGDNCSDIPGDVIREIDGIKFAFGGEPPGGFAGREIDFGNGQFFFRDK